MNSWLIAILIILVFSFILDLIVSVLNLNALDPVLPEEFVDIYDKQEYSRSQQYTRINTGFSLIERTSVFILTVVFLLAGGFNLLDLLVRSLQFGSIVTGIIYTGILVFLSYLISLPFGIFSTFVIEEKFGFNKTSVKTFLLDQIKGILLAVLIGGPLLALVLWFFENTGAYSWLYCWVGVVIFSLVLQFLSPILIMPLFNKFTPLEDGTLKTKIMEYAGQQQFSLQGIYTMDGSKRSTKLNAFFTGFGRFRKIVFYDTLVEKLSEDEIVAVLAHEMGHFKLHHIYKMLGVSILYTGIIFYLLSLILLNQGLFQAFGMQYTSIYASLIFFGFLFSPVNLIVSILFNILSRKHEYEADAYAATSCLMPTKLISALKALSQANLSNLTPHPLNVFLHYSHPPVLMRIKQLRKFI